MSTVHVIGAGISGLACATRAAISGVDVALYEAAGQQAVALAHSMTRASAA